MSLSTNSVFWVRHHSILSSHILALPRSLFKMTSLLASSRGNATSPSCAEAAIAACKCSSVRSHMATLAAI